MLASAVVNLVNSIRLREMPRRLIECKVGCASLEGRYKRQQCKAKRPHQAGWGPKENKSKAKEGARQHVRAPFFLNVYTWCHHGLWTPDSSFFSPQYWLTPSALQRSHRQAGLDWGGIIPLPCSETSTFLGSAAYALCHCWWASGAIQLPIT